MQAIAEESKMVVMSYIKALDKQDYESAEVHLEESVRISGPSEESFTSPKEFVEMLRHYRGTYDVVKTFVDGNDVCLLYNLKTPATTAFMCSLYRVENGKIASIHTVFDPRAFS